MRKSVIAFLSIILFFAVAPYASAATIVVQNYFYAHSNQPGTFYFLDKYNTMYQFGDNIEKDAVIKAVEVVAEGMAPGDRIILETGSGESYTVTPGVRLDLNVGKKDYIKIKLVKTGYNEVFARLTDMYTIDDADGGTNVHYIFSANVLPTKYGDLGPGDANVDIVNGNYYYWPPQDNYKYDYTPPVGAAYYQLHFDSPSGVHYYRQYDHAPTGVHYLTCNGTYEMRFYDSAGRMIAKSPPMVTTQIINPTCDSQPVFYGGYQDFNLTRNGDMLTWDAYPGAYQYYVYKDGQIIGVTNETRYQIGQDNGFYSVVAVDIYGHTLAQSDLSNTSSGSCNGCTFLTDMLSCPAWNQYMGEWESLLRRVLPPPPDWDEIADKIGAATIRHLSNYLGNVPSVPTKQQIESNITPNLPPLNTSVPESSLAPEVPGDFNTPMVYDITTGPEIPVEDESQPIEIYAPNRYINADDPGVMVFPGDPRNHSDGIKNPDYVDTGGPPVPAPVQNDPSPNVPMPSVPPSDMPTPTIPASEMPVPTVPPSDMPIPTKY